MVEPDAWVKSGLEGLRGVGRERVILALAERQHGVLARRQLLEIGLSRNAISHRVAVGRMHRVYHGVYLISPPGLLGPRGRWLAAVLACGEESVLSHRSAAALWGVRLTSAPRVDVIVPGRTRARQHGIKVHLVRRLEAQDRDVVDWIPVTSLPRTLLDLATILPAWDLDGALEKADRRELLDVAAVKRLCEPGSGRRGAPALRPALARYCGPAGTRSELERRFLDLCRAEGFPLPQVNVLVLGLEVDFFWEQAGLVVELDGFEFHRSRAAFERDRARDAKLHLAGLRVLRVTHRQLEHHLQEVVGTVRGLLQPSTPAIGLAGRGR